MLLGAPTAYWATVAGLIGLALGSFSTVLASRWPAGESLVSPDPTRGLVARRRS